MNKTMKGLLAGAIVSGIIGGSVAFAEGEAPAADKKPAKQEKKAEKTGKGAKAKGDHKDHCDPSKHKNGCDKKAEGKDGCGKNGCETKAGEPAPAPTK